MARTVAQEQVHLRIRAADLRQIDAAAEIAGVTRSAFVLAAALERAEAVAFDQLVQAWPPEAVAALRAVLDEGAGPAAGAIAVAASPKPWDAA